MTDIAMTRAQAYESAEEVGCNPSHNPSMGDIIVRRFSRRDVMRGTLAVAAISATVSPLALITAEQARAADASAFSFREATAGVDENHHVAEGYDADILIRWGDPVLQDAPAFDPHSQTAAAQAKQFGYNNDFVGYIPMPGAANPSEHGLLVVNHEYTSEELMFPDVGRQDVRGVAFKGMTPALVDIEMMAHGGSVIEIRKTGGKWQVVADSKYARRITAETEIEMTGPAAGDTRMRTSYDPAGRKVRGMLNNCAGGVTPWGTWLTCEENFNGYFWGKADGHAEAAALKRYGAPANTKARPISSTRAAVLSSTRATTSALTMSTNSSPKAASIQTISRQMPTCSTAVRSMLHVTMPTAAANGCRCCMARDR